MQAPWVLTSRALESLLSALSPDRDEAARRYHVVHAGLVRFFRGRQCSGAESLADQTIDRVCRQVEAGQPLDVRTAYFYGVARNVLREHERRERRYQRIRALLKQPHPPITRNSTLGWSDDEKIVCLRRCLAELVDKDRELIRRYYGEEDEVGVGEGRGMRLAERMGITQNNLRQRAYRIRRRLEECFRACLAGARRV